MGSVLEPYNYHFANLCSYTEIYAVYPCKGIEFFHFSRKV